MIQERFNQTIELIQRKGQYFPCLGKLLSVYRSGVVVFSFFNKPSRGNSRQNVLAAYELRAKLAGGRRGDAGLSQGSDAGLQPGNDAGLPRESDAGLQPGSDAGFGSLLEGLRRTAHSHICISVFITEVGTFTVFSDFGQEEVIGALHTSEAPGEVPLFSHLFVNGELLSREKE